MKFPCKISRQSDGRWAARHQSENLGVVEAAGDSREQVIEKLKGELRYRLELCPCSGQTYQFIDVEIIEQSDS